MLQCWRQWQDSVEEAQAARVALSFFSNITLRKAFNQWLVWAQERQEYGVQLQQAVQVTLLDACGVTCGGTDTSVHVHVSNSVWPCHMGCSHDATSIM